MIKLNLPLTKEVIRELRVWDKVLLSGVLWTARDAAHKRLVELLDAGSELPFPMENACIYYAGPTPAPPGKVIGAIGPTTSSRLDAYTPRLLDAGLLAMIGKGERSVSVQKTIQAHGAVYFGALGGAGALLASRVKEARLIAFPDLGTEAIRRLVVEDFPVTVLISALSG